MLGPSSRFFPRDLGRFRVGSVAPPVEGRQVSSVPGFAESRRAQVPVGADLTGQGAQVVPTSAIDGRAPKPVAVVDANRKRRPRTVFGHHDDLLPAWDSFGDNL